MWKTIMGMRKRRRGDYLGHLLEFLWTAVLLIQHHQAVREGSKTMEKEKKQACLMIHCWRWLLIFELIRRFAKQFGNVAAAMQHEVEVQEKAQKEPEETIEEKSIKELHKLGCTGTKVIKAASVFVRIPNQMTMLFAIPESLRREFILNMLEEEANKK